MAGDTNSNIFINIDTSQAMAQLRALEKELTALNRALVVGTKTAAAAQAKYAQGLIHNVNATGQWTASMVKMSTASEQFAERLDRSRLSLKEYFRYGMASTKTFGRFFGSEFDTVSKLVEKRVKTLQQQYVQLGRDAQGAMNALKFTPKALNYRDVTTQLMLATQRQQIFNKLLDDGAVKLLNFGKNTQWAGRQLMVGFTIPLMLFGSQAIKTFKEIETQVIRFKKVYGDIFTDPGQTDQALKNIRALADEYTKYGVKVSDTIKMAADAAAAGNTGRDLQQVVEQTNRLAVLGGVTQEKALETTIALKNAFQINAKDLDQTINFLNAVENQTVVALDDLTEAIPRVAPVVQQLGGDVKDLAFFMAAMQEGGISAAQGANALKSGLGSLINPSKKAAQAAADVGVNIKGIVEANQGNLRNIVVGFAQALQPLTDLQRTRVIEDVFGKYQFARISALLNNITKEGTQAARVLQLANASVEELGILAERELGVQADSSMNKFVGAVERFKAAIAPIGEIFAKTLTPAIEFITRMAERFNKLPEGIKKGIAIITTVVGGLGPLFLMTFGLLANAVANTIKGFSLLRKGYQSLAYGSSDAALKTQYLSQEELENISVTNALYSSHDRLSAAYKLEEASLASLIAQYTRGTNAMRAFSASNPGLFMPGKGVPPIRRAGGGTVSGPGTSTSDSIPAYLSDGEYVVNAKAVDKYGVETFDAINAQKFATGGMVTRNKVPRFFMGGWLQRALLPKQIVRAFPADGFELSGFSGMGGAARKVATKVTPTGEYYPSSTTAKSWSKIPWQEDKRGLLIRDPDTGEEYLIRKGNKEEFDKTFDDLVRRGGVQKRGERPAMSAGEYLLHRLYRYKKIKGSALTPTNVLGQAGAKGASRVRTTGASKGGAYKRWADNHDSPAVRRLQGFFDSERNHLRAVLPPDVFADLEKNGRFVVSPSHIAGAGKNRDASSWSREKILRDTAYLNMGMNYMTKGKRMPKSTLHPTTQREADAIISAIEELKLKGPIVPDLQATLEALKYRKQTGFYSKFDPTDVGLGLKMGGLIQRFAGGGAAAFLGMPKSFTTMQKARMVAQQIDARVRSSRFRDMPVTDFGVLMKETSGHSFPIPGVGGIYRKPNGDLVFVKPMMDEKAALAEQRATIIARKAHKLKAPKQVVRTMLDPTDPARKRKFIVLESPYEPELGKGGTKFTKGEYFKQLVASTLRGDKDLSPENVFGGTLADVGTAGVFGRASGKRDYNFKMPSMAEQAMINLLGVKGGAKKAFAENTADMIRTMSPEAYQKAMIKEIETVLPKLKETIKSFDLTNVERALYERMVKRLEAGKKVDWTEYHKIHSKVKPKKYANGVFSVPGPKGAGDVVPAMLSPGEAVIPSAESEKYRPLIKSIIADKVPGFISGDPGVGRGTPRLDRWEARMQARADRLLERMSSSRLLNAIDRKLAERKPRETTPPRRVGVPPNLANPFMPVEKAIKENTKAVQDASQASKNNTKGVLQRLGFDRNNLTEQQRLDRTRGFRGALLGYQKAPDYEARTTKSGRVVYDKATAAQKTNARQLIRMNRSQALMGPSMALGMAGSMAMMYGMSKPESFFGQNMNTIMGVTVLAGLLPLLNSPIKMLIAGVIGLVAVFKAQSAQIKQSIIDGREQGQTVVATTQELEEFGKLTNTVSRTQVAAERRAGRVSTITPVSMDFGQNLILNSDFGKKFKEDFNKTISTLGVGAGAESLSNKLATAVSQGVLTATQAESLAIAITRDLKDAKLEMDVRARLIQLIGPNGQNILQDPVQVQVDLIASNRQIQQAAFQNFQNVVARERSGIAGIGMGEAGKLGLGLVPATGAGAYAMGATAQTLGIQNSVRAAEAATKAKQAKTFMQTAELARNTGKIGMAINAVRAIRTGAAVTGVVPFAGWVSAAVGTVVTTGIEVALRKWQVGQEKKAIAKAAGLFSGITSEALKSTQQGIDALNYEVDFAIQNLELKKKLAKTTEERANVEQRIRDLEIKRNQGISQIQQTQSEMLKNVGQQYDQVKKRTFGETFIPGGTERGAVREKFMESYRVGLEQKFKGNAAALGALSGLQGQIEQKYGRGESDTLTLKIQTLIDSDVLTPQQASLVVANLAGDTKKAEAEIEAIVKVHGTEGLQRLATIQEFIPNEKNRKDLQVFVKTNNKQDANEVMTAIEEIVKLPSYLGFNIDIETQKSDQERLQRVGEEIADLQKMVPNGQISLKLLQDLQQKVGGPGKNLTLDAAIAQWDTLSKLPKDLQFKAMITLGTITQSDTFDAILNRELETAFKKQNATFALPTSQMPDALRKQYEAAFAKFKADQKNIDAATKAYFAKTLPELYGLATPSTVKTPTGGATDGKGTKPDTSWLEELLQRLKLLKETSIDATGTFSELMGQINKYFGPGAMASVNPMLDKTAGALGDIEKAAKDAGIVISTEFLDYIESLDAAGFEQFAKDFLTISKGKITGFKTGVPLNDAQKRAKEAAIAKGTYNAGQETLFGQVSEAFRTKTIAEFIKKQQESIDESNNQVAAFKKLTDATGEFKFDAMAAMEVLKDPVLAKEIALGKKIFSPEERDAIIASINKTYKAASALSQVKMIQDTQGIQNQINAFDKLVAAGYDYDTILKVIENDAYAYVIANDSVKGLSDSTKSLVKDTNDYLNALKNLENTKFFQERTNTIQLSKQFAEIAPLLDQMGVSLSDIQEILSNPALAKSFIQDLKDGKLDAEQLKKYLDQIPQMKTFDLKIRLSTREGQEQTFEEFFSKAMEYYDILQAEVEDRYEPLLVKKEKEIKAIQDTIDGINKELDVYERDIQKRQRVVEEKFNRPIDALQDQIAKLQKGVAENIDRPIEMLNRTLEGLQRKEEINITRVVEAYQRDIELLQRTIELSFDRPIAALQDESTNLSNDLTLMDDQVRIINEKYDKQEKALKTISDINQEILQQQQQQIGLADALTQGDVSAAARAAQEMRNASAAARAQNNTELLAAGRQYEIDNLRTKSGMTRSQVEQRQFAINQQIFTLEQQREDVQAQILIKEDLIYQKEQERLPLQQQMRTIQDQIYNLELSRIPIQDTIYGKEQEIYALEQQRQVNLDAIKVIEDTIYNIRVGKLLTEQLSLENANAELVAIQKRRDAEIEAIDAQREKWTDAKLAIDMAKIEAGKYKDVIDLANKMTDLLNGTWTDIANSILAATNAVALYNAAVANKSTAVITGNNKGDNNGDKGPTAEEIAAEALAAENAARDAANAAAEVAADAAWAEADTAMAELNAATASLEADMQTLAILTAQRDTLAANATNLLALAKKQGAFNTTPTKTPTKTNTTPKIIPTSVSMTGGNKLPPGAALKTKTTTNPLSKNPFPWIPTLKKSSGGMVKYLNDGAFVNFRPLGTDTIPAMLTPGEFVMSKYAVKEFGIDRMKAINSGEYDNEAVYNYSINVNVKSGANPDEIARAVMTQIKQVDSQRIRTQRVS